MPSIVPGFEYDIFISYRHKDNKGEHWVTEFVTALKTELEATFKEDISIYFDENPHDGLLATHDVDESLREKLKCLIFIPIISQTYCDPKSFAWNHEFLTFKKLAIDDSVGLKVKLSNGNVSSRILPVRIHELDQDDKELIESEVGPLRSIDFIFKSAGVNRPLTQRDNREENGNKTFYKDQVNKVANAIKEILSPIKSPNQISRKTSYQESLIKPGSNKKKLKVGVGVSLLILIAIVGYIYFPYIFKNANPPEKSIAVLAFKNLSGDPSQDYFSDGVSDEIILKLTTAPELTVTPRVASFSFKTKEADISEIASKLNVRYLLDGAVRSEKDSIYISVSLIDTRSGTNTWTDSYSFAAATVGVLKVQSEIALKVIRSLEVELDLEERNRIEELPTKSKEAYDIYLKGLEHQNKGTPKDIQLAINYYYKALEVDPDFKQAKRFIAQDFLIRVGRDSYARQWTDSALTMANELIEQEPEEWSNHYVKGRALIFKGNADQALEALQEASHLTPNRNTLSMVNNQIANVKEGQGNFDEAFILYLPQWQNNKGVWDAIQMAVLLRELDEMDLARKFLKYAVMKDPRGSVAPMELGILSAFEGDVKRAALLSDSIKTIHSDFIPIQRALGYVALLQKNYRQAEGYYLKFLEEYPDATQDVLPERTHLGKVYHELALQETGDYLSAAKNSEYYLNDSFRRDSLVLVQGDQSFHIPYNFALINFVRGNREKGYYWMHKAMEAGFQEYRLMLIEPILEKYRQDDEFKSIVETLKNRKQEAKLKVEKYFGMPIEKIPGISEETFLTVMFVGMGILHEDKGKYTLVVNVYDGSPADEAGVKVNDRIISYSKGENGEFIEYSTAGYGAFGKYLMNESAISRIKVKRDGESNPLVFTIKSKLLVANDQ